ncbi:MAG: helix-turn-helix domain-containing protein [Oscillospiraceae bacterium]|nr:helix-turn-helix domain-containing protein [Oscillospiraceae bacterium]
MAQRNKTSAIGGKFPSYGGSVSYPPFAPHQMHVHDFCEIFCVFRGDGYYITEGARHKFEHGKIFLMRPGESHKPDLTGDEPYDRISHHFPVSDVDGIDPERRLLSPFFDRPLGQCNVYDRSVAAPTGIYDLFSRLHEKKATAYETYLNTRIVLLSILAEIKKLFDAGLYITPAKKTEQIRTIIEYVNNNLTSDITVDSLCDKFFISRGQLYRNFRSATGSNVWDYVITKRLHMARSYIDDGLRITEAAAACGFGDYSSFYRAYTKKYGVVPSADHIRR